MATPRSYPSTTLLPQTGIFIIDFSARVALARGVCTGSGYQPGRDRPRQYTRLTFYDPASLEVTRTGLITLTGNIALNTINADGTRLARAKGDTVEILDLTALNEQGDPPILNTIQLTRRLVVKLVFAPDGKTIAVVSRAVQGEIGAALLQIYDMQLLRSFGSWEVSDVPHLSFSPDNRWLATSVDSGMGDINYYAIDPGAGSASEFTIQRQDVWESATFSADSQLLAAAAV